MTFRAGLMGIFVVLGLVACSEQRFERRFRQDGEPLISGTYTFEHPEVGSIDGCTATLIGPRLVVTAAHCIDYRTSSSPGHYNTFVIDDGRRRFSYPVDRLASYGTDGADDVALLHLSTAVPDAVASPARITSRMPPDGTIATIYGYGCQARGGGGRFAKQKFEVELGQESYNLCPGDSGGPTLSGDGFVLRVNSAYYVGPGNDIFGDVAQHSGDLVRTATSWGETLSIGDSSGEPPPPSDPGTPPTDPGTPGDPPAGEPPPGDPGVPPSDPMDPGTPHDPGAPSDDCSSASSCETATPIAGCGWCGATGRSVGVDACGYPTEDCPGDFRLNPEDCDGGGGSALCICIDGVNFAGPGCDLSCPDGSYCIPGTTALECWGF